MAIVVSKQWKLALLGGLLGVVEAQDDPGLSIHPQVRVQYSALRMISKDPSEHP